MTTSSAQLPASHPDIWHRQQATLPQRCGVCKRDMDGEDITDVRGFWEHYECLRTLWFEQKYTTWQGKQRDLIDAVHAGNRIIDVWYDRTQKVTDGRYFWRTAHDS